MQSSRWVVLSAVVVAISACDRSNAGRSPLEPTGLAGSVSPQADTSTPAAVLPPPERLWFSFEGRAGDPVRGQARGIPTSLQVMWSPVPAATGYVFEIGSAEGATDLAIIRKAAHETSHVVPLQPGRAFWARVKASGPDGLGAPSAEIIVRWEGDRPKLALKPSSSPTAPPRSS